MLEAGFIFIIIGLILKAYRHDLGRLLNEKIDKETITLSNLQNWRRLWLFFIYGWRPLIFLGIGLLLTQIIWR